MLEVTGHLVNSLQPANTMTKSFPDYTTNHLIQFLQIYNHKITATKSKIIHAAKFLNMLVEILVNPRNSLLLKAISSSVNRKITRTVWNQKFSPPCSQRPTTCPYTERQINPVRAITSCSFKIHFNIILPSTLRSHKWSLSFRPPPTKKSKNFTSRPHVPHALPISSSSTGSPDIIW